MASFFRKNLVPLLKKMVLPASVVSSPSLETSSGESSPTPPTNVSTVSITNSKFMEYSNTFKLFTKLSDYIHNGFTTNYGLIENSTP